MIKIVVASLVMSASVVLAPAADAEVSASCRLHLERVSKATGQIVTAAADRRHWAARGQVSKYCSEQDEAEESGAAAQQSESSHDETSHDDGKSRYCKKRWFC